MTRALPPIDICGRGMAPARRWPGGHGASAQKSTEKPDHLRQKRHSQPAAVRNRHL